MDEIRPMSPDEDVLVVPTHKSVVIDQNKNDVEFFFRVTIRWKNDDEAFGGVWGVEQQFLRLSVRGPQAEREPASVFIRALYDHVDHDKMVETPVALFGLVSAKPVLRHIVRKSQASVCPSLFGCTQVAVCQVYGTEMAVALADSLIEGLVHDFKCAMNSAPAQPFDIYHPLACFVAANQARLNWIADDCCLELPVDVQKLIVTWLIEDFQEMGFAYNKPEVPRETSPSPVSGLAEAFNGEMSLNGTIYLDDDDDDADQGQVPLGHSSRTVYVAPRRLNSSSNSHAANAFNGVLPAEYLETLVRDDEDLEDATADQNKEAALERIKILQRADPASTPPHPLVAGNPMALMTSPRAPPVKRGRGRATSDDSDQEKSNTNNNNSNIDKNNIKHNKNKKTNKNFGENSKQKEKEEDTVVITTSSFPGITSRKVKMKKNHDEEDDDVSWMEGLTESQIEMILNDTESSKENAATSQLVNGVPLPPHRLLNQATPAWVATSEQDVLFGAAKPSNDSPRQGAQNIVPGTSHPPAPVTSSDASVPAPFYTPTTLPAPIIPAMPSSSASAARNAGGSIIPPYAPRHIIIDGSNVAMHHGNNKIFSCKGIKLMVQTFKERNHENITVFVPQWRQATGSHNKIKDQKILFQLEKENIVKFTPCRNIPGVPRMNSYDDRFVVELAVRTRGVIVSNDKFRDLMGEKEEFKDAIINRLLPYVFVGDLVMLPEDPMGKAGTHLDEFLRISKFEMKRFPNSIPDSVKTNQISQINFTTNDPVAQNFRSEEETEDFRLQLGEMFPPYRAQVEQTLEKLPKEKKFERFGDVSFDSNLITWFSLINVYSTIFI